MYDDWTYEDERDDMEEKYGDECPCCGQKLRTHDNNVCNEANS